MEWLYKPGEMHMWKVQASAGVRCLSWFLGSSQLEEVRSAKMPRTSSD